jgi:catechol 2,3-dioxygenase-like lactoylglutathione lyase family enzyme
MTPTRILETCLYAENLEAVRPFYQELLNLPLVAEEPERHLFFRCGPGMLLIFNPHHTSTTPTRVNGSPIPLHGAEGAGHIAFSVENSNLDEWKKRLRENGINIESEVHWPGHGTSLYFRDPAENSVEIISSDIWKISS